MSFPEGFTFGISTAAYSIEGGTERDGRGRSIWDRFCFLDGTIVDGQNGNFATDHRRRWAEDVFRLAEAQLDAYRFSISWPRVLPAGSGEVSIVGLDFYDRLVDELLEAGVEPWACLFHWDLPAALEDRGGFGNRDVIFRYADYAAVVGRRLADRVRNWLMFNEPGVFATRGHLFGDHAPGTRESSTYVAVLHHQNLATAHGCEALRALRPGLSIGTVLEWNALEPATDGMADREATELLDGFLHRSGADPFFSGAYPEAIASHMSPAVGEGDLARLEDTELDFLGLSYSTRLRVEARRGAPLFDAAVVPPGHQERCDGLGRLIAPQGLTEVLARVSERYGVPVVVTACGLATDGRAEDEAARLGPIDDHRRIRYLEQHLEAALEALERGIDLRGFFVRTLVDGFEWADGLSKRWGLIWQEPGTGRRVPKASWAWYRDRVLSRSL